MLAASFCQRAAIVPPCHQEVLFAARMHPTLQDPAGLIVRLIILFADRGDQDVVEESDF